MGPWKVRSRQRRGEDHDFHCMIMMKSAEAARVSTVACNYTTAYIRVSVYLLPFSLKCRLRIIVLCAEGADFHGSLHKVCSITG